MRIEVANIQYQRGMFHLGPLEFSLQSGEILGIGGPNGSGKSTLMRLMLKLLEPRTGEILIDGTSLSEMSQRGIARRLAYLPQNLFAPLNLAVQDVLLSSEYSVTGRPSSLDSLLTEFAIEDLRNRDFNSLSGGEKRLVMLAGTINQGSGTILMDEPDTFLDIDRELFLFEKIRELAQAGKGVVLIFHDINKIARLCDKVLLLKQGKQIAFGDAQEILVPEILERIYNSRFRARVIDGRPDLFAFR